jgi:hypothetical protein
MRRASFTKKRILLGIALIIAGLLFLDRTSFWPGFEATFADKLLFLSTVFIGCSAIVLGGAAIGGMQARIFLKGLSVFGLWTFAVVLPILLLPLGQEVLPIAIGFSSLLPIVSYLCYIRLRQRHIEDAKKEQK